MNTGSSDSGCGIRNSAFLKALSRESPIFAFYAAVTIFMTYPAITLTSRTYAEPRDPLGALWWFWWLKYSFFERTAASPINIVGVPAGLDRSPYGSDLLYNLTMRGLSIVSTETVAYNIVLLLSFFLTGVMTYYLVRYLTGKRSAAALSGFILAFCPYMLVQGKEHLSLISVFWIPAFFLLLIKAYFKRSVGAAVSCGGVFIVLTLYCYQFGFIIGISVLVFMITLWLTGRPWKRRPGHIGGSWKYISVIAVVLIVISLIFVIFTHSPSGIKREFSEVVKYSARPWDYVLPHAEGRAFGYLTRDFIKSHLHGSSLVENSLFLGYIPIILALFAIGGSLVDTVRKRRARKGEQTAKTKELPENSEDPAEHELSQSKRFMLTDANRLIFSFTVCGVASFLISMPPSFTLFGGKIYMPSFLLFKLAPQFRAYARFGAVTMFCVAVLCGYAVSHICEMKFLKNRQSLLVFVLSTLVFLEFAIAPPFYSLETDKTTDYFRWLEGLPGKPVAAVYPMFYIDSFDNYGYFFQQRFHKKPLVNGAGPDTYEEDYRQSVMDIKNPMTPGLLKGLGTKYVLIIPGLYELPFGWYLNYPFPTKFNFAGMPSGLKEIKKFDGCTVYEVTAGKSKFVPIFDTGFYQPYIDPEGRFWHPCTDNASVTIDSESAEPVKCRLSIEAATVRGTGSLRIFINGEETVSQSITQQPCKIIINDVTLRPGNNHLQFVSDSDLYFLTEVPGYESVEAAILVSDLQMEKTK